MPTPCLVNACLLKWDALDAANFPGGVRPAIYFAEPPAAGLITPGRARELREEVHRGDAGR